MVLPHTTLRINELGSIQWSDVDFTAGILTIDEAVMKRCNPHIVPMSRQVSRLLKALKPVTEPVSQVVFAGKNDTRKSISENTLLLVIRQIGYEGLASGHGFATILHKHEWPSKTIERQLAHTDKQSVRGIYNPCPISG